MKSHPASNLCWSSWTSCCRQSWRGVGEEELWSCSGDPLETRNGGDHDSAQTQRTLICQHLHLHHHDHHDHHQKQSKVSQIINYQQLSSLWWWTTSCGDYNKEPWYNRCRASTTIICDLIFKCKCSVLYEVVTCFSRRRVGEGECFQTIFSLIMSEVRCAPVWTLTHVLIILIPQHL